VFTDPLSVTYNSVSKSLPRISTSGPKSLYRTADGEFSVYNQRNTDAKAGLTFVSCRLTRVAPDPTPADVFDAYRMIANSVSIGFGFDTATRANAAVDIPLLRTALLSLVDSTYQGRLIGGEL